MYEHRCRSWLWRCRRRKADIGTQWLMQIIESGQEPVARCHCGRSHPQGPEPTVLPHQMRDRGKQWADGIERCRQQRQFGRIMVRVPTTRQVSDSHLVGRDCTCRQRLIEDTRSCLAW